FTAISAHLVYLQQVGESRAISVDGARIPASVLPGVGFLVGASIGRARAPVRGLMTTAGLWLVTAIGLCAGGGLYAEAGAVTGLGALALAARRRSRDERDTHSRVRISIVLGEDAVSVAAMVDVLNEVGATVTEVDCHRHLHAEAPTFVTFGVRRPDRIPDAALVAE